MDNRNRTYSNDDITVYWKPAECIHAGICFRELRKVFDPAKRPWIDLSKATTQEIIDIVDRCPTDALTYKDNVGNTTTNEANEPSEQSEATDTLTISIMKNGPILVEGSFKLIYDSGKEQEIKNITSLCRCGMSKNMPHCDGTHTKKGFFPDTPNENFL